MKQDRALVADTGSQLLQRGTIQVDRGALSGVARYLVTVVGGWGGAVVLATVGLSPLALLVMFGAVVVPPTMFLGRRLVRFGKAGLVAADALRIARRPVSNTLADITPGQWVRVRGHVLSGATFASASGRTGCVLAWYLGTISGISDLVRDQPTGRWELRGLDFTLALTGGERVRVLVHGAHLVDAPMSAPEEWLAERPLMVRVVVPSSSRVATIYQERTVGLGDEIEVMGLLRRDVDPDAESGYRGARTIAILSGNPPWPLIIRARG